MLPGEMAGRMEVEWQRGGVVVEGDEQEAENAGEAQ